MSRELADNSRAFFSSKLLISDAPISFVNALYHSTNADDQLDYNPAADNSMVTDDSIFANDNLNEEDLIEQGLFLDSLTLEILNDLSSMLKSWIETGRHDFWTILNVSSKDGDTFDGKRARSGRKGRRSSVRLSVSLNPAAMDVPSKALVAILHQLMVRGCRSNNVPIAILAAKCYLLLLQTPGMAAYYSVFNPMVIHDLLQLMRFVIVTEDHGPDAEATPLNASDEDILADIDVDPKETATTESFRAFTAELSSEVALHFVSLVEEVAKFLRSVKLNGHSELLLQFVSVTIELIQTSVILGNEQSDETVLTIRKNCIAVFEASVLPIHGRASVLYRNLFRELVPLVSYQITAQDKGKSKILKKYAWIKAHIPQIFRSIVDISTDSDDLDIFHAELYIFVQNLCVSMPEKSEERDSSIEMVGSLVQLLPNEKKIRFVKWAIILGTTVKVALRALSCDLVIHLLAFIDDPSLEQELVASAVLKCRDKAPAVRTRALTKLSLLLEEEFSANLEGHGLQLLSSELNGELTKIVCDRIKDEKSVVRKAAINFTHKLVRCLNSQKWPLSNSCKKLLFEVLGRTMDSVAGIRKLCLEVLVDTLRLYTSEFDAWKFWVRAAVNLISDDDSSIADFAFGTIDSFIISSMEPENSKRVLSTWELVFVFAGEKISYIFDQIASRKYVNGKVYRSFLETCFSENFQLISWRVLSMFKAPQNDKISANKLHEILISFDGSQDNTSRFSLIAARKHASLFLGEQRESLINLVVDYLESGRYPLATIPEAIELLAAVKFDINSWAGNVRKMLALSSRVTLSELIVMAGSICSVLPELSMSFEEVLRPYVTDTDVTVKSLAIMSLGKVCLQNEPIAKQYVSVFVRELDGSNETSVKVNCLVVLGDISKRFSRLVEIFVPLIADAIRDPIVVVRAQALRTITKLLMDDYVKWKGNLFFKFITSVVDDNEVVASLGSQYLSQLSIKNPQLYSSNFLDIIILLNGNGFGRFSNVSLSSREESMFCIRGPENADKRSKIYRFLVKKLQDDQKFQLTRRLCTDVLKSAVAGQMDLSAERGSCILKDTLQILSGKEIKSKIRHISKDTDIEDAENKIAVLQSKIHSQISRKLAVETIIPIVVRLKRALEEQRSVLIKDVMVFLREIVKDYRVEMQDVLAGDRQLAHEIEFDLRNFEKAQASSQTEVKDNRVSTDGTFKAPFPKLKSLAPTPIKPEIHSENKENVQMTPVSQSFKESQRKWNLASPSVKLAEKRLAQDDVDE